MLSDGERETVNKIRDLNARVLTQVFLVIYHQANLEQFPLKKFFAEAVIGSFTQSNGLAL